MLTLQKRIGYNYKRSVTAASLVFFMLLFVSAYVSLVRKEKILKWNLKESFQVFACQSQCRPPGSESLPKGIVAKTSNLERRPLWGSPKKFNSSRSLFTLAVGIKQKDTVDLMVQKFLERDFVVMLFHYDGVVDEWNDLDWSDSVVHISALNQTKWWFAKRFLHPDIVADYDYVFLWDEDIGVQHFSPERYLSIVEKYGLEISQPALDPSESEVHHQITVRGRSVVHRRMYKKDAKGHGCDDKSSGPPCSGWIELMAPVFSRAAWRCVWYMIQNDLIHAWGLDMHLGYCAQGDRTEKIGVVDAEYIVHYGLPTLGVPENKTNTYEEIILDSIKTNGSSNSTKPKDVRVEVRRQSFREYKVFRKRWSKAVNEDQCWTDPFSEPIKEITLQKEKE